MKRRRRPTPSRSSGSPDTGMTLVELTVAFLLMAVLFTVVMSVASHFVEDDVGAGTRIVLASEGQLALDNMAREIRAAVPEGQPPLAAAIEYASPTEIEFYSNLSAANSGVGPVQVEIDQTGSSLVEKTWTASLGTGGVWEYNGSPYVQTLATDVNSSEGALFSYYPPGEDAATGPPLSTDPPLTQAGGGTEGIGAVQVDLWLSPHGTTGSTVVEDVTTVQLLNEQYAS
ncbi:MAG: PulJ/GspJ family protein [Acidimicrobiales bacterium]